MRQFTEHRTEQTADEIWLLEHPPVFTMGQAAKAEHLLHTGTIPVAYVERGGQVTYHGPGQLVAYLMLDLKRLRHGDKAMTVKNLVCQLEQSMIDTLGTFGIKANRKTGAPGVYVSQETYPALTEVPTPLETSRTFDSGAKIGALGLKIRKNCCFHGLALNVEMDLEPFTRINPCGYANQMVTDMKSQLQSRMESRGLVASDTLNPSDNLTMQAVRTNLAHNLALHLGLSMNPTTQLFEVNYETH